MTDDTQTEVLLPCPCTKCGQLVNVRYVPNDIISEEFVRLKFICDTCRPPRPDSRKRRKILEKLEPKVRELEKASLPYKDDNG